MQIIVVFPKIQDAKNIMNAIVKQGFDVVLATTTGAQAISKANELDGGLIISGYKLMDMYYADLYEYLPKGFELLLMASKAKLDNCYNNSIVCVEMPLRMRELIETLNMISYRYEKQKKKKKKLERKAADKAIIERAKSVLMERNHMSEEEAHYYLQKTSMDAGTALVEVAEMVLSMQDII
mgnify:CR=1 FL=1